jgi:hypothetical protein
VIASYLEPRIVTQAKFLQTSIQSEKVLSLVVEMLQDISHHLSLLLNYQSQADLSEDVERALVEVFIDIITFGAYIATFLRKHSLGK